MAKRNSNPGLFHRRLHPVWFHNSTYIKFKNRQNQSKMIWVTSKLICQNGSLWRWILTGKEHRHLLGYWKHLLLDLVSGHVFMSYTLNISALHTLHCMLYTTSLKKSSCDRLQVLILITKSPHHHCGRKWPQPRIDSLG